MLRSGVGVTVVLTESCQYVLDVCIRLQKKNVSWEEKICNSTSIAGRVEFNGTAFVVLGWQLLECCYGKTNGTAPTDNQQVVVVPFPVHLVHLMEVYQSYFNCAVICSL